MNDVLDVSRYIINYCKRKNITITNLKLQKLLYFVWIEYFKKTNQFLFQEEFCAWPLGPVVDKAYDEFCIYAGTNISAQKQSELNDTDIEALDGAIEKHCWTSVSRLVNLSHTNGKPWSIVYNKGKGSRCTIPYSLIIEKECAD